MIKQLKTNLPLLSFLILGFIYRIYGLKNNYSFWTDEAHVAVFVRAILERGKPVLTTDYSTGIYQWLWYWLSAISAKILGLNDFAIRFPSVVFGVLSIGAVYFLGKELFNKNVGLAAAVLTTFLKIEILWSRQARPYQALQFFFILAIWLLYRLTKDKETRWRYLFGFLVSALLASLMHGLGIMIFASGFLIFLTLSQRQFKTVLWVLPIFVSTAIFVCLFWPKLSLTFSIIGKVNNLFYYRVFLSHNYLLLLFFSLAGTLFLLFEHSKKLIYLIFPLAIQTILVSFLISQPFTRYFYPAFLFLVLLAAVGLEKMSEVRLFGSKYDQFLWISLCFVLFVALMGNKFALLPETAYSLNENMQEIPEVNYKKIYKFIGQKLEEYPNAVFVSSWNDHALWFLGEGKLDYRLRKNPLKKDKDPVAGASYIGSVEELRGLIKKEKKGLVLLESWETELPLGIDEFIKNNLKKELEVDRLYPAQPKYWPVEVYSWGM